MLDTLPDTAPDAGVEAAFDTVMDALAEAAQCDREALGALLGTLPASAGLSPEGLVDRIVATDLVAQAALAIQARDLAAFGAAREAEEVAAGEPLTERGGTAGIEVGLALNVAAVTGQHRIHEASRAVHDHPRLLELVGSGAVSMAGLRRVCAATDVLEPDQRHVVDRRLARDAVADRLSPGQLEKAALARVLQVDPAAADKRAAAARRRRCVRLGDPVDGLAGIFARLRAEEALAVFGRLDRTARGMRREGDPRSLDELMADLCTEWLTGTPLVRTHPATDPAEHVEPPVWRSRDGWEPWLWSDPPPRHPTDDPAPDDPAWDRYLDPADTGPVRETAESRDGSSDDGPTDDRDRSGSAESADGTGEHPAHGPPPERSAWRLPVQVEVQVVIGAATLLGLDETPGLLRGYGAVPGWVLHDLADSARATGARTMLRGLFCDPDDGRLVAMDSTARFFTGGLREFALYRDQSCRVSGGRIVDVDHIVEHASGGPTSAANGQALGKLAHVVKDNPAITVTALPPGRLDDGLDRLRIHAPDIEWAMPTGHAYRSAPSPALGSGSQPDQPASVLEQHLARLLARLS